MKIASLLHPFRTYKNQRRYKFYKSPAFRTLVNENPKQALDIFWQIQMHYPLNWEHPQTLNEKNFWLEGMTDTTRWTEFSDKFLVRKHIEDLGLGDILTHLYGYWENADDIDFDHLPNKFVIKCNHDCGSAIVVKDKSKIDKKLIRNRLSNSLERKYGYDTCEPHYTRIHPLIIAEELLEDKESYIQSSSLVDYKFFCFDGKPHCCMVCYDRGLSSSVHDVYNLNPWQRYKNMSERYANQPFKGEIPCPRNLDEMTDVVSTIAKGFPFVRIDLYNINDERIVFGEMTFTPHGGLQACFNQEAQLRLGEMITLPQI